MKNLLKKQTDLLLKFLLFSFPILIILGPAALNFFSIIFSLYAILNIKELKKIDFLNKKIFIIFFSFSILIFPYNSIEFQNSFIKYLSFFRFLFMFFGLIIFFNIHGSKNSLIHKICKIYVLILIVIIIDVLIEYFFGSNILGYKSFYSGRIASFTNDELIIGYVYNFMTLFTLMYIYKRTNITIFFIILSILIMISFIIGERSNFIKLTTLLVIFSFIHFLFLNKFKFRNLLILFSIFTIFIISFYQITKNTYQGKKFYGDLFNLDEYKLSFNIKEKFYVSTHAAHYITAYKIFLNYPLFGIGINNFSAESQKEEYENTELFFSDFRSSTHPHQIYLEIISEVGLVGSIYFIFILFYPIYISLKTVLKNKEFYLLSHLLLHIYFIFPILPSGSFFGTNYGIPFWVNLSLLIYLSRNNLKF